MDRTQLLVRKAKRGDTDAYGELIRIHKDYFYRNAFCYVKNIDDDFCSEFGTIAFKSIFGGVRRVN